MAAVLMMLLFLFKSKYRRKSSQCGYIFVVFSFALYVIVLGETNHDCSNLHCVHGSCENSTCVCDKGWQGANCEFCGGRIRLTNTSGFITDGPGNYSFDIQCTWLIEAGVPNTSLRLRLEHFATECSWDHVYIFDGDSMFSPLIAAYSGLVLQDAQLNGRVPEVVATSGFAFLHFFSDVAYNMTGFNISYSIDTCPQNCSGFGVCLEDKTCTCNADHTGAGCETPICPAKCGRGTCNKEAHHCECPYGFQGLDCHQPEGYGYWIPVEVQSKQVGRASHQAIVHENSIWVFGGYSFQVKEFQVIRYDLHSQLWELIIPRSQAAPSQRYGHSVVLQHMKGVQYKAYVFGGITDEGLITDDLWTFDFMDYTWTKLDRGGHAEQCTVEPCPPLAVVGHTATLINMGEAGDRMIVIFGHSPVYGYMSLVQEYNFSNHEWSVINTTGAIVKGGYGHTSLYDSATNKIYVHGGYNSVSLSSQILTSDTYSYDPKEKKWILLTPSRRPRYLHSSVIINAMMLVFGGNTHNDTSRNLGAKCYSTEFLAYDTVCDIWYELSPPMDMFVDIARFGHSAVVHEGSMYVYGGFNGRMLDDMLKYTPGSCGENSLSLACVQAHPGIKCIWNNQRSQCESFHSIGKSRLETHDICPSKSVNYSSSCEAITSCTTCLHSSYDCIWCGNFCSHRTCKDSTHQLFGVVSNGLTLVAITPSMVMTPVKNPEQCDAGYASQCSRLHNCHSCQILGNCMWEADKECYALLRRTGNHTEKAVIDKYPQCSMPCSQRTSCENCTTGTCIWCGVEKRCVESNAYVASFPYGQCMEWTTQLNKCPAHTCSETKTCEKCHENPMCGWCDDGSGTGLGVCLEGGSRGPIVKNSTALIIDHNRCQPSQWYFTDCPKCQCNGHSTCPENSDLCTACQNLTEGPHCEFCILGYYGDPTNGGNCIACDCNYHSTNCHRETGKCFCTTKGITGHHCERCDEPNHYYGDPKDGGTCFYDLTIDFQFTFNLSKTDDRHYNQINFKNTPTKADTDADFSISCSLAALINITVKTASQPEWVILDNYHCSNYKSKYSHTDYSFGSDENTTFFVYVYDFQPPMWIQIAFSQQPKLDLLQFFITFSSCFLSLLIIAAIMWKLKQKIDIYRRRQRLFVEMEQMASRPFATNIVEIEDRQLQTQLPPEEVPGRKKKKERPSPIALEPCAGGRAAVLSLIVRLPTGESHLTPPGQSGIAIASSLVTLGSHRKLSVDMHKGDPKAKGRKHISNQHPDTCI